MSRVIAIIQGRLGSSRCPRKILADIVGKPLFSHVLERACAIPGVDCVALTIPAKDAPEIVPIVRGDVEIFKWEGGEDDVLGRFCEVVGAACADAAVRLTADCPLLDPAIAGRLITEWREATANSSVDVYGWIDTRAEWPDGCDVEIFPVSMLKRAHEQATDPSDREHVGPWMRRNEVVFSLRGGTNNWPKLSVDTQDDLDRIRAIYEHLKPGEFGIAATLEAARKAGVWNG